MHFCGTESYVKKKSIVISCITVSGMYKTMILISNRIDFGIFQTFALNSFLHTGILHNQKHTIWESFYNKFNLTILFSSNMNHK